MYIYIYIYLFICMHIHICSARFKKRKMFCNFCDIAIQTSASDRSSETQLLYY